MKRLFAVSAALLGSVSAYAADLPVKAAPFAAGYQVSWTGLYGELYGFYAANTTDADIAMNGVNIANIATSPHGPGIGASLGYYFPIGGLVIGPRLDGMWANLSGSGSALGSLSVRNATNWLGDADVCVGIPLGPDSRLLGYGCAGFAFGGAKPNFQVATVSQGISDTSTGWNAGLGLKYQLTLNWTVGIEGGYYQLGDKTLSIPLTETASITSTNKYHEWVQRLAIGYRF